MLGGGAAGALTCTRWQPISFASLAAMHRPRPVPAPKWRRAPPVCACVNASNRCGCFSSRVPTWTEMDSTIGRRASPLENAEEEDEEEEKEEEEKEEEAGEDDECCCWSFAVAAASAATSAAIAVVDGFRRGGQHGGDLSRGRVPAA
jgi:hypothetical protein